MPKIINFSKNYIGFGISAMEKAISQSILKGRSYGGVTTLVQNKYLSQVTCLMSAERFVIIMIGLTIYINVYFPFKSPGSSDIIKSLLLEIGDIISLYPDYSIVLGGDLNNDLTDNSESTKHIRSFMSEFNMTFCNELIAPNCNYTYHHRTLNHWSCVDYFMILSDILLKFEV